MRDLNNWVAGGDFNVVMKSSERSGETFSSRCADEFKDIMERLEMVDLPLTGGK